MSTTDLDTAQLPSPSCRIYVHDVTHSLDPRFAQSVLQRTENKRPRSWADNQWSIELHLQRGLLRHPWRVHSVDRADIIYVAANFSLMCTVGMQHSAYRVWEQALTDDVLLWPRNRSVPPKFIAFQASVCMPPWTRSGRRPADAYFLRETVRPAELHNSVLSPFAITHPRWLVEGAASDRRWAKLTEPSPGARLLFFAGNIPKLYLSTTRYRLWRELRRDARVTTLSSTLYCTVGAYSICRRGKAALMSESLDFFRDWCKPFCGQNAPCGWSGDSVQSLRKRLSSTCRKYIGVNYTDELADMLRDTRRMSHADFLRESWRHRFCLVTPGDWDAASPKISESIAVGGAGGCIPVLIVPSLEPSQLAAFLPYTRWLIYPSIAVLESVKSVVAPGGAQRLLQRLEAMPQAEIDQKHQSLARVARAFVIQSSRSGLQPNSVDAVSYIASEMCALVQRRTKDGTAA